MLHKPKGYEVTRPKAYGSVRYRGQRTVYSLLPEELYGQGWVPVGRLDKDSSGLLLFVREGFLTQRLQLPGNIEKVYEVWVKGHIRPEHLEKVLMGVETPIGVLRAKSAVVLGKVGPNTLVRVVLSEGKNRQIRRIFGCLKDEKRNRFFRVLELSRVSLGPIQLDLEPGSWRYLSEAEFEEVMNILPEKKKRHLH